MSKEQRDLFFGLIRIHVLVHASHEPVFGLAMMEELAHHGYRIGPGTLYPIGQHSVSFFDDRLLLFDDGFNSAFQYPAGKDRTFSAGLSK